MGQLSKKYKHGDIVVILPHKSTISFAKILQRPKLFFRKDFEKFDTCKYYAEESENDFCIIKELSSGDITWIEDVSLRLATRAELVLYGK